MASLALLSCCLSASLSCRIFVYSFRFQSQSWPLRPLHSPLYAISLVVNDFVEFTDALITDSQIITLLMADILAMACLAAAAILFFVGRR